jgi:hypothetical protein
VLLVSFVVKSGARRKTFWLSAAPNILLPREKVSAKPTDEGSLKPLHL